MTAERFERQRDIQDALRRAITRLQSSGMVVTPADWAALLAQVNGIATAQGNMQGTLLGVQGQMGAASANIVANAAGITANGNADALLAGRVTALETAVAALQAKVPHVRLGLITLPLITIVLTPVTQDYPITWSTPFPAGAAPEVDVSPETALAGKVTAAIKSGTTPTLTGVTITVTATATVALGSKILVVAVR